MREVETEGTKSSEGGGGEVKEVLLEDNKVGWREVEVKGVLWACC